MNGSAPILPNYYPLSLLRYLSFSADEYDSTSSMYLCQFSKALRWMTRLQHSRIIIRSLCWDISASPHINVTICDSFVLFTRTKVYRLNYILGSSSSRRGVRVHVFANKIIYGLRWGCLNVLQDILMWIFIYLFIFIVTVIAVALLIIFTNVLLNKVCGRKDRMLAYPPLKIEFKKTIWTELDWFAAPKKKRMKINMRLKSQVQVHDNGQWIIWFRSAAYAVQHVYCTWSKVSSQRAHYKADWTCWLSLFKVTYLVIYLNTLEGPVLWTVTITKF
jgi:hypothetical protein